MLDFPWKLILSPFEGAVELYRIDRDPNEDSNLVAEYPDIVERLRGEIYEINRSLLQRKSARGLAEDDTVDLSEEEKEMLRSLGYLDN